VAAGAQFGVEGFAIGHDLEATAVGGDEGELFDFWFVGLQQFGRQTGGALGVVSDGAVGDFDVEQHR
jgi:hypothetical protein